MLFQCELENMFLTPSFTIYAPWGGLLLSSLLTDPMHISKFLIGSDQKITTTFSQNSFKMEMDECQKMVILLLENKLDISPFPMQLKTTRCCLPTLVP